MRIISKAELSVARFASGDISRGGLRAVRVAKDHAVACNGFAMVKVAEHGAPSPADFPTPKEGPLSLAMPEDGLLIMADDALAAAKQIPKKPHIPVLGYAVTGMNGGATPKIVSTDLGQWNTRTCEETNGQFPNTDRVWPTGDIMATVDMDASRLRDICDFIVKHSATRNGTAQITINLRADGTAVEILRVSGDRDISAILMPMRREK